MLRDGSIGRRNAARLLWYGALIFLVLAPMVVAPMVAAEPGAHDGAARHGELLFPDPAPLREIRVEGLRRTREQVVLDLVPVRPGELVTARSVVETEEEIIDSNLFAEVAVVPERPRDAPETLDLVVTVREKWTLIPLPFFLTDGSSVSGGFFLIESNLLGRNKQLITALFGGGDGISGFFAYVDPSVLGTPWNWRLSSGLGRNDSDHVLPDGTQVRSYTQQTASFGTGLGYRFTREIRAGAGVRVELRDTEDFDPGLDPAEPAGGTFVEPDVTVQYDGTRPRGVLRLGPEVRSRGRMVFGGDENESTAPSHRDPGWEVSAQAGYSVPFISAREGRARFLVSGGTGEMSPDDKQGISARDGFRTLPYQRTVADQWASGAAFLEVPVLDRSWGALVLSHYWEGGAFDDSAHDPVFFGGPGGGFRVFLREVAIPAVGLDLAYNLVDPSFVFSFTIGARM